MNIHEKSRSLQIFASYTHHVSVSVHIAMPYVYFQMFLYMHIH